MWYHFLLIHIFENDTIISIKNIPPVPFDLAHFYGVQSYTKILLKYIVSENITLSKNLTWISSWYVDGELDKPYNRF